MLERAAPGKMRHEVSWPWLVAPGLVGATCAGGPWNDEGWRVEADSVLGALREVREQLVLFGVGAGSRAECPGGPRPRRWQGIGVLSPGQC